MNESVKPKKKSPKKLKKKIKKTADSPEETMDHERDFGGLADRDLKKGLGCGG